MTPSIFSSDSHLLNSRHLAPPPPVQKTSGLKNSLRRIPSALFSRSPPKKQQKSKLGIYQDPDTASTGRSSKLQLTKTSAPRLGTTVLSTDTDFPTRDNDIPLSTSNTSKGGIFSTNHIPKGTATSVVNSTQVSKIVGMEVPEKTKTRTKTRKALADILGWGNHSNIQPSLPQRQASEKKPSKLIAKASLQKLPRATLGNQSSIQPVTKSIITEHPFPEISHRTASVGKIVDSSPPPPPVPPKTMPLVLKKPASSSIRISSQPSQPIAVAQKQSSLRTEERTGRPSIGDDPFGRTSSGAEVIDKMPNREITTPSVKSITTERRASISSNKAMSARTNLSDDVSLQDMKRAIRNTLPVTAEVSESAQSSPQKERHVSAPLPSKATLIQLPIRTSSLGRVIPMARPITPQETAFPTSTAATLASMPTITSIHVELPHSTEKIDETTVGEVPAPMALKTQPKVLKKEKTKSKIWGLLGGRNKKSSKEPEKTMPAPVEHIASHSTSSKAAFSNLSFNSQSQSSNRRPPPPALHVTHPSQDIKPSLPTSSTVRTTNTMTSVNSVESNQTITLKADTNSFASQLDAAFGDSPLTSNFPQDIWKSVGPTSSLTARAKTPTSDMGTFSTAEPKHAGSTGQRNIEALLAPRGMPKRKSLSGLFGSAVKSLGRKVVSPPVSPLQMKLAKEKRLPSPPISPSQRDGERQVGQEQMRLKTLAEELDAASPEVLRDSGGYKSRFGHFHGFHLDVSDGNLSSAAAATDQLLSFVSAFEASPMSNASENGSRKPSLVQMTSFSSLRADANGSPTPLRKIKSAMLTEKSSSSSPLRQHGNVSPLKLALHHVQAAKAKSGVFSPSDETLSINPFSKTIVGKKSTSTLKNSTSFISLKSKTNSTPFAVINTNVQKTEVTSTSLVKKGMKNIFAPPSPAPVSYTPSPLRKRADAEVVGMPGIYVASRVSFGSSTARVVERGRTVTPETIRARKLAQDQRSSRFQDAADVPSDLQAMFNNLEGSDTPSPLAKKSIASSTNLEEKQDRIMDLGLPIPPPIDRRVSRRPPQYRSPPLAPLPPLPTSFINSSTDPQKAVPKMVVTQLLPTPTSVRTKREHGSVLTPLALNTGASPNCGEKDNRMSFDFTGEYNSLEQGEQRASFVDALRRVGSADLLLPMTIPQSSPMASVDQHGSETSASNCLHTETQTQTESQGHSAHSHGTENSVSLYLNMNRSIEDEDIFADARSDSGSSDGQYGTVRDRKQPFRGQLAFQQHASNMRVSPVSSPSSPHPSTTHTDLSLPTQQTFGEQSQIGRGHHNRGESVCSILTMSSIGAVIDSGIAGEYTNYFDKEFAQALQNHQKRLSVTSVDSTMSTESIPMRHQGTRHRRGPSTTSIDSVSARRPPGRRGHHRRQSSISSIDSLGDVEMYTTASLGPPVSMHNPKRGSYISKHRRSGSTASGESFDLNWTQNLSGSSGPGTGISINGGVGVGAVRGRTDWAARHRKTSSVESTNSIISVHRLVRPGLGERMFHLDGGVQLTSITGSPPEASHGISGTYPESPSPHKNPHDERRHGLKNVSRHISHQFSSQTQENHHGTTTQHSKNVGRIEETQVDDWDDSLFQPRSPDSILIHTRRSPDSILRPVQPNRKAVNMVPKHRGGSGDSVFGRGPIDIASVTQDDTRGGMRNAGLHIHGRPISDISMSSTDEDVQDDTFINVNRYRRNVGEEECLEGEGEDSTLMTPIHDTHLTGRQLLMSSLSRPQPPRSRSGATRRRPLPPPLNTSGFDLSSLDTPGLTSPSASETSGRASLETSTSDHFSFHRIRPKGAGHNRQKSSAGIFPQPTIREEPSNMTLRPSTNSQPIRKISRNNLRTSPLPTRRISSQNLQSDSSLSTHLPRQSSRNTLRGKEEVKVREWDSSDKGSEMDLNIDEEMDTVSGWLKLQREVNEELRRNQNEWEDSEETKLALADFSVPQTFEDISEFLKKSNSVYKPLPIERPLAHRRKSSLSNSRTLVSPYGLTGMNYRFSSTLSPFKPISTNQTFEESNEQTFKTFESNVNLGLPKPPVDRPERKKGSLITKFERTHSATSATFQLSEDTINSRGPGGSAGPILGTIGWNQQIPKTAPATQSVFAQFTRALPPSPPPKVILTPTSPFNFQLPSFDAFGLQADLDNLTNKKEGQGGGRKRGVSQGQGEGEMEEKRNRVTSNARRQALGWGRRRNSDGPDKIVAVSQGVVRSLVKEKEDQIAALNVSSNHVQSLVNLTSPGDKMFEKEKIWNHTHVKGDIEKHVEEKGIKSTKMKYMTGKDKENEIFGKKGGEGGKKMRKVKSMNRSKTHALRV
ncbi:hypothetical protein TREMEDRAFT_63677 [Tremella mesenterica DSM 1558]|uniref:uncharacterized protein n=1 Tax=Tremella mesenterica (strain ATCC 24925 / CBS 8224 / DSM 1558 / NBRC 9311 / NRRL Y-6157 / RJB 2259-6 / UBC 559-6) TaxID=578456 RepID=UPI0003F49A23|nr:uncharacterized protein TREMEDRAFT_63677 [Tremella mesenterica DSM 1558]EIW68503.1 hypothetical protein TREMEDRAFT_63677 [Tremella mesenterica DSM 1558]